MPEGGTRPPGTLQPVLGLGRARRDRSGGLGGPSPRRSPPAVLWDPVRRLLHEGHGTGARNGAIASERRGTVVTHCPFRILI